MRKLGIIIVVFIALIAYNICNIPLPEEATDTFTIRMLLFTLKITNLKSNIYGYLYGKEAKYSTWVSDMSDRFPYSPKPERIEEGLKISDTVFRNVPVRMYEPLTREKNGPAVMFYHGGGWIVGSVESYDSLIQQWARNLNLVVVSVEYRLAPKHPYPEPFQDCFDAAKYFLQNAREYDVDPSRIALAGDSAGGNLAAAVSLKIRDVHVTPQPKLQVLMYPVTQASDFNLPSYITNENDVVLSKERMVVMWMMYASGSTKNLDDAMDNRHVPKVAKANMAHILNHDLVTGKEGSTPQPADGNDEVWDELKDVILDPYFAPLMAEDLSGLPVALVYTAEQDVLRDEGILYAHRLKEAGTKVFHLHNKAAFHGLNSLPQQLLKSRDASESNKKIYAFIKKYI